MPDVKGPPERESEREPRTHFFKTLSRIKLSETDLEKV